MAFPELPDDRRARPRRYRGGAVDGGPDMPDDRASSGRRSTRVDDASSGTADERDQPRAGASRGGHSRDDQDGDDRSARARRSAPDGPPGSNGRSPNGRPSANGQSYDERSVPDGGRRRARDSDDDLRFTPHGNGPRPGAVPDDGPVPGHRRNGRGDGGYPANGYPGNGHSGNGHPPARGGEPAGTNGSRDGRPPADRLRDAYSFNGSGPDDLPRDDGPRGHRDGAPRDEGRRRRRYLDERGPDEFGRPPTDREPPRPPPAERADGPRFADGRRPPHTPDSEYGRSGPPSAPGNGGPPGGGRRRPGPDDAGPPAVEPVTGRRRLTDAPAPPPVRRHPGPGADGSEDARDDGPGGRRPDYRDAPARRENPSPEAGGRPWAPVEPGPPPRPGDDPRTAHGRAVPRRAPDPRASDPRAPDPRGPDPRSAGQRHPDRGAAAEADGWSPGATVRAPHPDDAPADESTRRTRRDDAPGGREDGLARRRTPPGVAPGAAAYAAGDDDPAGAETGAVPARRTRRPSRPEEPPEDASAGPADPTARPRAPGRRAERPAEQPDPDEADEYGDPEPDEEYDETDGPRVGKRSGPVGIGGRLSALTSRSGTDDGKKKSFWRELPLLLGVALVLTFLIQTFVAKVFVIPSGSMETTLHGCTGCTNDRVLVDKVTYNFTDIAPGDVVVFRGPPNWSDSEYQLEQSSNPIVRGLQFAGSLIGFAPPDEQDFVKRVIAVGGQEVSCCDALNQVMVDGQPLEEPYIYYLPEAGPARQIPFGPITVPQGEMWVMGDSRNNSADSRAAGHGPVPEENVIGKVRLIVLPFDRFGWVDAVDPQTSATAAGPSGGLPDGTSLALGMMGAFPFALSRRRSLALRAERERFVPVRRRRGRWRRTR